MAREFTVGRAPSNSFVLSDSTVSGHHAELSITGDGRLFVVDCASRNGTFTVVSGVRRQVRQATVSREDVVVFGECEVPAGELLSAVSTFMAMKAGGNKTPHEPRRFIRCVCGTVREEGSTCAICGIQSRKMS